MAKAKAGGRAFDFIKMNEREPKPRTRGVTEIRGPYYTPMGKRYLLDILETMGAYVDSLKFAAGSFSLMPREAVRELTGLCHEHNVLVSTGGFIEYVLTQGREAVHKYIEECKELGFDIIEISSGFITIPTDDWLRLVEKVQKMGLKAKPEVGIQFGAGGASAAADLEEEGTARRGVDHRPGPAVPRRRRVHDHDRVGGDHRKREDLAHRCPGEDRQRARPREGHVRGGRARGVRVVHQELRRPR